MTRAIAERFGEDVIARSLHNGNQVVYVQPSRLVELAQFINRDAQLKYESLVDVCAVDRLKLPIGPDDARFQGVYIRSYSRKKLLTVVSPATGGDSPHLPSLAGVFKGAIWPERESYDLIGVVYDGHPDLRRIMMPKHWPYHPLQKQVPVGGEEVPFTPTWDDPEFETFGTQIYPSNSAKPDLPA
ncbi:MAG: NADH-quinone oxidoreductase subunit C [Caldilineaceae bacterium]